MGRIIPYIMENKIHVWNHQPVIIVHKAGVITGLSAQPQAVIGAINSETLKPSLKLEYGLIYPPVIKHSNWKSPINGGLNRKINCFFGEMFHCHVWLPEGIHFSMGLNIIHDFGDHRFKSRFPSFTIQLWEFQDPKMEVLCHIRPYFVGIFPYIGLKHRPNIYGIGTSNFFGSWDGHGFIIGLVHFWSMPMRLMGGMGLSNYY